MASDGLLVLNGGPGKGISPGQRKSINKNGDMYYVCILYVLLFSRYFTNREFPLLCLPEGFLSPCATSVALRTEENSLISSFCAADAHLLGLDRNREQNPRKFDDC